MESRSSLRVFVTTGKDNATIPRQALSMGQAVGGVRRMSSKRAVSLFSKVSVISPIVVLASGENIPAYGRLASLVIRWGQEYSLIQQT